MVNALWAALFLAGLLVAVVQGRPEAVTRAALDAAQGAVTLALELVGVMALWLGLLRIAEEAGLVRLLARVFRPVLRRLFPSVPSEHPALGAIIMNLSASFLGLGNAATPFGLRAMAELQKLNPHPQEASEAMCTFLALNTSCITLIPATIIAVRAAAGSAAPTEIVGPAVLATSCATVAAVLADFAFRRLSRSRWPGPGGG
ncbi:MAG: spore maturation protein [Clostridia bacterium]|nr:spore maturation protein [Clostridia bacterium]